MTSYSMGELFCGPGGLATGAHAAAKDENVLLRHAWANDYDRMACATYLHNVPGAREESVIEGDVRSLDLSKLDAVDGFAFGFPCNDYSIVGEAKGLEGNFGPLYSYGVTVLNRLRPAWFVAENVAGLRSSNGGADFARILEELRKAGPGYTLTPHLYRFEQYGVPQSRHRIIIVGLASGTGKVFRVPAPTHLESETWVTAKEALRDIPSTASNQENTRISATVRERLSLIEPGKNAFNTELPEHLKLHVKGATLSQIYKRLDPNRPAYTITGSGGGGTHGYHWDEPRPLTNRERARLQTFGDEFEFKGPIASVRRQIGMAVPPEGARAIFRALFRTLEGREYDYVPSNLTQEGHPVKH